MWAEALPSPNFGKHPNRRSRRPLTGGRIERPVVGSKPTTAFDP